MKTDKLLEVLKSKSLIIPGYLLINMKELRLEFKELLFLSVVINELDNNLFNVPYLEKRLNLETPYIMEIVSSLCDKKLIEIEVKEVEGTLEEVINLDTIYSKILLNNIEEAVSDDSKIYDLLEKELGRVLSPIEYELVSDWITSGISEELIKEALKEAVLNGVSSLKYIDKILGNWTKKGYKKKIDIKKGNRKEKEVTIPDIDWLDLDE